MNKNKLVAVFCVLMSAVITLLSVFAVAETEEKYESRYLTLHSGEVSVVFVPGVKRVAIGNPDIVNYKTLENGQVMLIAAGPGKTNVHIWGEGDRQVRYWISVDQRQLSKDVETAKILTRDMKGLHIYQLEDKIIVEGSVLKRDAPRLEAVASLLPNAVMAVTERTVDIRPTVRIDAVILEISNHDLKKIGVDWDDTMSGPTWAFHKTILSDDLFKVAEKDPDEINKGLLVSSPFKGRGFYSYFGITSFLMSKINLLNNTGEAKILSSPKLTTTDGQKAKFNVGGEFPIPFTGPNGAIEVSYKQYGITLEVKPDIEGDIINMELKVELSDIDPSVTILGVPGTKRRDTETIVQLKDSQTLAISGLFQNETSGADNKVPFLGDVPVIKHLFSSHDSDKKDRQIVVLITPHLMTAGDETDRSISRFGAAYMNEHRKNISVDDALLE